MGRASVALLLLSASLAGVPQQPTFRSGVQTVAVHATARSADGRLVTDLTAGDFEVRDNGRPVEVTLFSTDPQPITSVLLLDMSGSMESHFLRVREATGSLIDALRPGDRLRIGTFGEEVALSPLLTGDKQVLRRVLNEELWPGGLTPLWSAVLAGMQSLDEETGRRVIVALTDGSASDGNRSGRARKIAQDGGFVFYAIGTSASGLDPAMVSLAKLTGGSHSIITADQDLAATFSTVIDELRHQYLLGFVPAARDGRLHTLDVRVTRPRVSVRARRNYRAPGAGR